MSPDDLDALELARIGCHPSAYARACLTASRAHRAAIIAFEQAGLDTAPHEHDTAPRP